MAVCTTALALELHDNSRPLPNTLLLSFMLDSNIKDPFPGLQNESSLQAVFTVSI